MGFKFVSTFQTFAEMLGCESVQLLNLNRGEKRKTCLQLENPEQVFAMCS